MSEAALRPDGAEREALSLKVKLDAEKQTVEFLESQLLAVVAALNGLPDVCARRPFDDGDHDGYQESIRDWSENNNLAVEWFLERAPLIASALSAPALARAVELDEVRREVCEAAAEEEHLIAAEPSSGELDGRRRAATRRKKKALADLGALEAQP